MSLEKLTRPDFSAGSRVTYLSHGADGRTGLAYGTVMAPLTEQGVIWLEIERDDGKCERVTLRMVAHVEEVRP